LIYMDLANTEADLCQHVQCLANLEPTQPGFGTVKLCTAFHAPTAPQREWRATRYADQVRLLSVRIIAHS